MSTTQWVISPEKMMEMARVATLRSSNDDQEFFHSMKSWYLRGVASASINPVHLVRSRNSVPLRFGSGYHSRYRELLKLWQKREITIEPRNNVDELVNGVSNGYFDGIFLGEHEATKVLRNRNIDLVPLVRVEKHSAIMLPVRSRGEITLVVPDGSELLRAENMRRLGEVVPSFNTHFKLKIVQESTFGDYLKFVMDALNAGSPERGFPGQQSYIDGYVGFMIKSLNATSLKVTTRSSDTLYVKSSVVRDGPPTNLLSFAESFVRALHDPRILEVLAYSHAKRILSESRPFDKKDIHELFGVTNANV